MPVRPLPPHGVPGDEGGTRPGRHPSRRPSHRRFAPTVSPLEGRLLRSDLSAVQPSAEEQYMLQLMNRARANPAAEARRLVALTQSDPVLNNAVRGWDLAAFVRQATAAGAQPPLAFNTRLIAAARDQDARMLAANAQAHAPDGYLVNGVGGRVAPDGQVYFPVGQSSWSTGENLFAYSRNVNGSSLKQYADYYHAGLLIDWGNSDFGHLKNILAPGPTAAKATGQLPYSQVGIGLVANANPTIAPPSNPENPANRGLDVGPVLLTEEFAWKAGDTFLTGAAYRDLDGDNFYTPGEGLGGVTITAVGQHGEGTYSATTWDSGGYSLALPSGTFAVTASGPGITTHSTTVTIGHDNVGWDVTDSGAATASAATATPLQVVTLGGAKGQKALRQAAIRARRAQIRAMRQARLKPHR